MADREAQQNPGANYYEFLKFIVRSPLHDRKNRSV